jgi:hypothetical protein
VHADLSLNALNSTADVILILSRQEVFGQRRPKPTPARPVVAFNTGGLPDFVAGWLKV